MCDTAGLTLSFLNERLCGRDVVFRLQSQECSLEVLQISTHFFLLERTTFHLHSFSFAGNI